MLGESHPRTADRTRPLSRQALLLQTDSIPAYPQIPVQAERFQDIPKQAAELYRVEVRKRLARSLVSQLSWLAPGRDACQQG